MKKPMDTLKKCKLIYSGELVFLGIILAVLGALFLTSVIKVAEWKKWFFTILTLLGSVWAIVDLIWTLKVEKRRKKSCLLDKFLLLPNGLALIVLDIIALINLIKDNSWTGFGSIPYFQIVIGVAAIYGALIMLFEGIYHWFKIHPLVLEMVEEEKAEALKNQNSDNGEEPTKKDN